MLEEVGQRLFIQFFVENIDPEGIHWFLLLSAFESGLDVLGNRLIELVVFEKNFELLLKIRTIDRPQHACRQDEAVDFR